MKREQVPQDDDHLMEGRTRDLCYAVDENGEYVQVLSTGWEPKNAALMQAWEEINEQARAVYSRVQAGATSPLAFFMAQCMFDITLLSDYTGLPKRKVKAHLEPESFRRLDEETLMKNAEAFNITVEDQVNCSNTADPFSEVK